jgi:hypothetical protein
MFDDPQLAGGPATDDAGPAPSVDAPSADACPRCQKPLIDPNGLGWCKACGFCRSLEEEKGNQLLKEQRGPSRGAILAGAAGNIPVWFWILLGGVGVIAGGFLAADRLLPPGNTFPRALWTSILLGVGLALIFVGQLIAVVLIAPEDEKLNFKDAIVPTRLWPLVAKRLPRLCGCLFVSTWGLALMVFALVFIGGLPHWFTYLPNSKNNPSVYKR